MIHFLDLQRITASFQPQLNDAVRRVVESGWYLNGSEVKAFEQAFADYCHTTFCVSVANGLDALYLALEAKKSLDPTWHDGDEVIVPAMTFIATAEAVVRAGLRPVMIDVKPNALIDENLLESVITPRTCAIIPVHLYGQTAAMEDIRRFADDHNLFVLEDAAQAHGGVNVARHGHAAAFSFYPGKNLGALGDGGALVTDDADLAERVRTLANYGAKEKYHHRFAGCNSRLDEVQAAVLSVKLNRLDEDNRKRRAIVAQYQSRINNPAISLLSTEIDLSVWHIFPVFCAEREKLQKNLTEEGVQTLIHYPVPVHHQGCMSRFTDTALLYPVASQIADTELSIPLSPVMTQDEIDKVILIINNFTLNK